MGSTVEDWDAIAEWWRGEVAGDPVYREQILPMVGRLLGDAPGRVVDLGCGEGQGMRLVAALGGVPIGVDLSRDLLGTARRSGPVVRWRLPDLSILASQSLDAALAVYVVDLLADLRTFFRETARVVVPGGVLVAIVNHPVYTPDDAGPIVDADGEVLWRWGRYLGEGTSDQPAGRARVRFHHRPLASLLTAAADAGWCLAAMEEEGLGPGTIAREPGYAGQEQIPRILGARWVLKNDADPADMERRASPEREER